MAASCATCGAAHDAGARFCSACGAALWRECPACGAESHAAAGFCAVCGAALVDEALRAGAIRDGTDERRIVTILFADLAGSTALGDTLDPEDVRAIQSDLFALASGEVVRFGGTTEKFVGDAVVAVFGVPRAHEDDPERAVRAALAIAGRFHGFADQVQATHGLTVGLRIGVNTGEVVSGREAAARGELVVSGDAVNVAARLQQLAEVGTILVSDRTRQATHRAIRYAEHEPVTPKGKATPLTVWRAVRPIAPSGARPASERASLIGRESELEFLQFCANRARRDRVPQLVTVFGPAGVGKSRLLTEFAGRLADARVLVGRCVPYGDGINYLPLAQIASDLAEILDDDPADVARAKLQASIEAVLPSERAERVTDAIAWTVGLSLPTSAAGLAGGGDVRRALHEAWTAFVGALGQGSLVVLVVEDIHWASEALLDLLDDVVAALTDTQVLLVCPARPELLAVRPTWGGGRLNASALTIAPLGQEESVTLLGELLEADDVSSEVVQRIVGSAEGNPFFVEEMLAMLIEQGAIERRDGAWVAASALDDIGLPDSIHGVIAARIDLLQSSVRDALRRCSVVGRVFWPSAVGVDDDLVATLADRALVSESPRSAFSGRREFAFKHALTCDVAYATLPRAERRELHQRVADWINTAMPDRQGETVELVAYHLDQALRHGQPDEALQRRTFGMLLAAGDAALRRGSYPSATRLLARNLELSSDEREHAESLLLAARVDIHNGAYPAASLRLEQVIDAAAALGDPGLGSDALGWKARSAWLAGDWQDALESAQRAVAALDGLPESPEHARALARLSQIEMLRGLPVAVPDATRAMDVARRVGERTAEANARTNLFTALSSEGIEPARDEMLAVVDLALDVGAPDEAVRAVVNYFWGAATLGSPAAAEQTVLDLTVRIGPGLASENYAEYMRLSIAALALVPTGRWAEADIIVAQDEPLTAATNRLVWLWLASGLALRRGDLGGADRHLPELVESAVASREPQRIVPMASVAMPRALIAGEHDTVRELGEATLGTHTMAISWAPSATSIVRSLTGVGAVDLLEQFEARLATGPDFAAASVGLLVTRGLLARLAGDATAALALLSDAEARTVRLGRPYEAACLALEVAEAHDGMGDSESASAARGRADAVLTPLGCVHPY